MHDNNPILIVLPSNIKPVLRDSASKMQSVAVLRNHVFDNAQLREFGDGHVGESGLRLGDVNGQLKRLLRSRVGALPACQSIR